MSLKALKPLEPKPEVSTPAETDEIFETIPVDTSITPLTTDSLMALIAAITQQNQLMQQQILASQKETKEANEKLAAAIIKTTEPREVLKSKEQLAREENDRIFYEQAKELKRRQKETTEYEQRLCEHIAGGLGETKDVHQRTSIVWHRTDAQVDIGICTTCGRRFHPEDKPDDQGRNYTYWRRKGSFNKISAAGNRQFLDPLKAQHDSYLRDS